MTHVNFLGEVDPSPLQLARFLGFAGAEVTEEITNGIELPNELQQMLDTRDFRPLLKMRYRQSPHDSVSREDISETYYRPSRLDPHTHLMSLGTDQTVSAVLNHSMMQLTGIRLHNYERAFILAVGFSPGVLYHDGTPVYRLARQLSFNSVSDIHFASNAQRIFIIFTLPPVSGSRNIPSLLYKIYQAFTRVYHFVCKTRLVGSNLKNLFTSQGFVYEKYTPFGDIAALPLSLGDQVDAFLHSHSISDPIAFDKKQRLYMRLVNKLLNSSNSDETCFTWINRLIEHGWVPSVYYSDISHHSDMSFTARQRLKRIGGLTSTDKKMMIPFKVVSPENSALWEYYAYSPPLQAAFGRAMLEINSFLGYLLNPTNSSALREPILFITGREFTGKSHFIHGFLANKCSVLVVNGGRSNSMNYDPDLRGVTVLVYDELNPNNLSKLVDSINTYASQGYVSITSKYCNAVKVKLPVLSILITNHRRRDFMNRPGLTSGFFSRVKWVELFGPNDEPIEFPLEYRNMTKDDFYREMFKKLTHPLYMEFHDYALSETSPQRILPQLPSKWKKQEKQRVVSNLRSVLTVDDINSSKVERELNRLTSGRGGPSLIEIDYEMHKVVLLAGTRTSPFQTQIKKFPCLFFSMHNTAEIFAIYPVLNSAFICNEAEYAESTLTDGAVDVYVDFADNNDFLVPNPNRVRSSFGCFNVITNRQVPVIERIDERTVSTQCAWIGDMHICTLNGKNIKLSFSYDVYGKKEISVDRPLSRTHFFYVTRSLTAEAITGQYIMLSTMIRVNENEVTKRKMYCPDDEMIDITATGILKGMTFIMLKFSNGDRQCRGINLRLGLGGRSICVNDECRSYVELTPREYIESTLVEERNEHLAAHEERRIRDQEERSRQTVLDSFTTPIVQPSKKPKLAEEATYMRTVEECIEEKPPRTHAEIVQDRIETMRTYRRLRDELKASLVVSCGPVLSVLTGTQQQPPDSPMTPPVPMEEEDEFAPIPLFSKKESPFPFIGDDEEENIADLLDN